VRIGALHVQCAYISDATWRIGVVSGASRRLDVSPPSSFADEDIMAHALVLDREDIARNVVTARPDVSLLAASEVAAYVVIFFVDLPTVVASHEQIQTHFPPVTVSFD
jgi:hypothetical protein